MLYIPKRPSTAMLSRMERLTYGLADNRPLRSWRLQVQTRNVPSTSMYRPRHGHSYAIFPKFRLFCKIIPHGSFKVIFVENFITFPVRRHKRMSSGVCILIICEEMTVGCIQCRQLHPQDAIKSGLLPFHNTLEIIKRMSRPFQIQLGRFQRLVRNNGIYCIFVN